MEVVGSLPCSEKASSGPYPEPDESNPHAPTLRFGWRVRVTEVKNAWILMSSPPYVVMAWWRSTDTKLCHQI